MVQGARALKIVSAVGIRTVLLLLAFCIGLFTSTPTHTFIESTGSQPPDGFFGSSWGNWEFAWVLSAVFWGGIIFGILGKKIDYIFFGVLFLFALWDYSYSPAMPLQVYLGLIIVAISSLMIGFGLKLLRQKLFNNK